MLQNKWLIFAGMLYIFLVVFSNLMDSGGTSGNSFIGDTENNHLIQMLDGMPFLVVHTDAGNLLQGDISSEVSGSDVNPISNGRNFFEGLWGILSWDYSFFNTTIFGFPTAFFRYLGLIISMSIILPLGLSLLNSLHGILPSI